MSSTAARFDSVAGATVVDLAGEVDVACVDLVRDALCGAIEPGRPVLVDMSECTYADVMTARLLEEGHRRALGLGVGYVVVLPFAAASPVRRLLLELVPEVSRFPFAPTLAAARARLDSERRAANGRTFQALRAEVWKTGSRNQELLAERDLLVLEQRRALTDLRRRALS